LDEAITKAAEKEALIQKLTDELVAQAEKLQFQEKAFTHAPLTFRRGWVRYTDSQE
jgi:myosin-5